MIPHLDTWKLTAQRGLWAYKGLKSIFALVAMLRRLGKHSKKQYTISPERPKQARKPRNHKSMGQTVGIYFLLCKYVWTVKKRYY